MNRILKIQTGAVVLLLVTLVFPYPKNLLSYTLGVCLGIAFLHWLFLPRKEKITPAFNYALPYLALYVVLFVSCFFAENPSVAFPYCGRQFILIAVPLVFCGMSPSFFTECRIRIFAFSFIIGVLLGILWKAGVGIYVYTHNGILDLYRERGLISGLRTFYSYFGYWYTGFRLLHPAFEALLMNAALVLVLSAWIRRDKFFSMPFSKTVAGICVLLMCFDLLLFCTKTAALGCIVTLCVIAIYAVLKKRYVFTTVIATFVLAGIFIAKPVAGGMIKHKFGATEKAVKSLFSKEEKMENDGSLLPRILCVELGVKMFCEKPVIGWGPAVSIEYSKRYGEQYAERLYRRNDPTAKPLKHPHNQFLLIMDSFGVIGLVVFLWLFAVVLREVRKRNSLFWWFWFVGLLTICTIDILFNRLVGYVYLGAFHGILYCENHG